MATITAATASPVQPGAQLSALQYQLQQAKQEAARAQDNLASLQNQTEQAQRQAEGSQRNVESLQSQSEQAQTETKASTSAMVVSQAKSVQAKTPSPAIGAYIKLAEDSAQFGFKLQSGPTGQLFVNTQGQRTGRIVSLTA